MPADTGQSRPATESGAEHGSSIPGSLSAWKKLSDAAVEHSLANQGH